MVGLSALIEAKVLVESMLLNQKTLAFKLHFHRYSNALSWDLN
jgi:hypothetical protein